MTRAPMKFLVPAAAMTLLAACSVLPKREPVKIYEPVRATTAAPASWPAVDWSLVVMRPSSGQQLDSERIAVRPISGEVQVYKGAVWTDDPSELLQSSLLRRLEDSGKILTVARQGNGVRGQYQLQIDLRNFDSIYRAEKTPPDAVIEFRARLVAPSTGQVVASRNFRQSTTARSEETVDVVAAFSQSLSQVTDEVAGWTLESGQVDVVKKKP